MKPALEKFLLIAATLAAIGIFIYVALWTSIKDKKTQMDNLFNRTNLINVPLQERTNGFFDPPFIVDLHDLYRAKQSLNQHFPPCIGV
ncbi:hypothetical protein, partial [Paenibacillus rigui]